MLKVGLPWWLSGKESACSAGDASLIPGLGRSPGEGNGYPLQYSHLGNPMDRVYRNAKSWTRLSEWTTTKNVDLCLYSSECVGEWEGRTASSSGPWSRVEAAVWGHSVFHLKSCPIGVSLPCFHLRPFKDENFCSKTSTTLEEQAELLEATETQQDPRLGIDFLRCVFVCMCVCVCTCMCMCMCVCLKLQLPMGHCIERVTT